MRWKPVVALLLLAPVLGDGLSTATAPLDLLPPWNLVLFVALYGCGALLVRELVRRHGLGWLGLVLLAAAYAVWEEALVDRFWFTPAQWRAAGLDDYSAVWHTNVLLAVHLTGFHLAVSIGGSIVVVERCWPGVADRPWLGRRGLVATGAVLLVVPPLLYGHYDVEPTAQLLAAAGLVAALAPVGLAAWWLRHADAGRIVTGVLAFFCLLCTVVGLTGRYDTTLLGLVGGAALVWGRGRLSSR